MNKCNYCCGGAVEVGLFLRIISMAGVNYICPLKVAITVVDVSLSNTRGVGGLTDMQSVYTIMIE